MRHAAQAVLLTFLVACGAKPGVGPGKLGPEICDNGKDDNGDKKVDCLDPQCFRNAACAVPPEICDNDLDDDGNSTIDCADGACNNQLCGPGCLCVNAGPTEFSCSDGIDNDHDSLSDCLDPDCFGAPECNDGGTGAGGGTGTAGGGTGTAGGGTGTAGGGTGTAGGGSGASGGGSSASGGGSGASGGGTSAAGGGASASGGGTSAAGGGSSASGGGAAGGGAAGGGAAGGGAAGGGSGAKETACSDELDNDGDGRADCADSDCAGTAACTALLDGKPCSADGQCAGGKCSTEAATGYPSGHCFNATSCTVGSANAGCHGGQCVASGGGFNLCRPKCTGTGLGATGRCRPGYACSDPDSDTGNNNNVCVPLCSSDAECSVGVTGYGCNVYSKLCESKDKGKKKYGDACTADTQCETGFCFTGVDYPGGYCVGLCRGDSKNCGPSGLCNFNPQYGDNIAVCYQGCTSSLTCRVTTYTDYECLNIGAGKACDCYHSGEGCGTDRQCCSGTCGFFNTCN